MIFYQFSTLNNHLIQLETMQDTFQITLVAEIITILFHNHIVSIFRNLDVIFHNSRYKT